MGKIENTDSTRNVQPNTTTITTNINNITNNTDNTANTDNTSNTGNTNTQSQQPQQSQNIMYVIKRKGDKEPVDFSKCQKRLTDLINKAPKLVNINATEMAQLLIARIYDGIHTYELDELAAEIAAHKTTIHYEYNILASRIIISNHHKNTCPSFTETITKLWQSGLIADYLYNLVIENSKKLNDTLLKRIEKDYDYDYFGFKTLEKSYLMKINNNVVERPQYMLMRVALAMYRYDIKKAIDVYKLMSDRLFTPATPTLFNMGTKTEQGSSCFLLQMSEDSIDGIFKTLSDTAKISKCAGGIGLSIHNIRAKGTGISGTNGTSNGIVPMLKVFNETARYVDQGGGKRNGSFAIYIEPWHADILDYIPLKKNTGAETERARDLFYAIWMPDLFMKRVKANEMWSLMCPHECRGLADCYGEEFENLYEKYEREGKYRKQIRAQTLFKQIVDSQIETGTPYMLFKDSINRKNNQANLGVIKCSNLCTEIVQYTSPTETAVCNLTSIALPQFIEPYVQTDEFVIYSKSDCKYCIYAKNFMRRYGYKYREVNLDNPAERTRFFAELNKKQEEIYNAENPDAEEDFKLITSVPQIFAGDKLIGGFKELYFYTRPSYNYAKLRAIVKVCVQNLNNIIDYNYYPTPECKTSNFRNRPIGVGVQGLADVFAIMRMPFDSVEAAEINKRIFAHMYLAGVEASVDLAQQRKKIINEYKKTNDESLRQKYNIIDEELTRLSSKYCGAYATFEGSPASQGKLQYDLWDVEAPKELAEEFAAVKEQMGRHGIRNSLIFALMPTASTSQILGFNECFEAFTSNIYKRRTMAGEFSVVNKYLIDDLIMLDSWNEAVKENIIVNEGSVAKLDIPDYIKNIYKTVWEISQMVVIDMAKDRSPFICQTQSMNIHIPHPTFQQMTSMLFKSWEKGLKCGMYYLRQKGATQALQFTIAKPINTAKQNENAGDEGCLTCSS